MPLERTGQSASKPPIRRKIVAWAVTWCAPSGVESSNMVARGRHGRRLSPLATRCENGGCRSQYTEPNSALTRGPDGPCCSAQCKSLAGAALVSKANTSEVEKDAVITGRTSSSCHASTSGVVRPHRSYTTSLQLEIPRFIRNCLPDGSLRRAPRHYASDRHFRPVANTRNSFLF
jgi:hypothetical protein